MAENGSEKSIHVFVFAYPSHGHIAPTLELSYLLIANGLSITYVSSEHSISRIPQQHEEHPQLQLVGLPDGLPNDDQRNPLEYNFHQSCFTLQEPAEKLIKDTIQAKDSCTHVIISDIFVTWIPMVAEKFHLQWFPIWLASFSSFYFFSKIHTLIERGYVSSKGIYIGKMMALTEFVECLPELPDFCLVDLPRLFGPNPVIPVWFIDFLVDVTKIFEDSHILLGNSFEELEGDMIQSLRDNNQASVYPVGPLLPRACFSCQGYENSSSSSSSVSGEESKKCIEWLDLQRLGSVLYVAFGSIAMLSPDQQRILAKALHASGRPFLWVIREMANPFLDLDLGLEDYNGLIISWSPQVDVLNHPSVGAFLTHCGFNSTMEAICAGVPLIIWPQVAEQPINAKFIVDKWKVGIKLQLNPDGMTLTGTTTVSDCIKQIFDEDQSSAIRLAMSELRSRLLKAVNKGGSSHSSLVSLIKSIRMK